MNTISATATPAHRPASRMAFALGTAAALTVAGVVPYALALLPAAQRAALPPITVLLPLQVLQGFVLFNLMAWIGLRLGERVGLDAPLLRNWLHGEPHARSDTWWRDALVGALLALAAVGLVVAALDQRLPTPIGGLPPAPTPWQGFLASFYGGIAEELQVRLFLMTLVAWLAARLGATRKSALLLGVVVAAIAFGAAHLPAAAQVWPLDAIVVTRTIVANALPGLVFGALYARHGLECAIVAHFVTDIGLHVVAPLVAG